MKQLRMARKMVIGAALASTVLASAPAWAANVPSDTTTNNAATSTQTGSSSTTATSSASLKTKFPDVGASHWALQHITKLAIEGIVEGNEAGQYKPEDAVSQQDVLIMAIRMMGAEADAKSNNVTVKLPFDVSDYAKSYVVEAINLNLITIKEETDANATAKTVWGSRTATREWVAKIMVRLLGKQTDAERLAGTSSTFTDQTKISSWAKGYVGEAVALNLVQGFEDGSFQPQGSITRAQMATFLSRSEKQTANKSPRFAKGYVNAIGGGKLVLQDLDGNLTTYNVPAETPFYGKKEGEKIAANTIQQTYEVSMLQAGGTAYYVEVTNDQLQMDTFQGSLISVDMTNLKLYLMNGDTLTDYEFSNDVAVTDATGQGSSVGALVKNSNIEIRRNKLVKSKKYTQIIIKQVPVSKTSEGTVQTINANEFKILDKASGKIEPYALGALVNVKLPGNVTGDLSSLHVGDTVSYTVSSNQVTAVTVTKQIDIGATAQGTLIGTVNAANPLINISSADGTLAAYYLSDTVRVVIDGKPNANLNDLVTGDEVKLELLNKKVQTINVTNRTIQNLIYATIDSYDDTGKKYVIILKSTGEREVYNLNDQTAFVYYGSTYTLANFSGTFTKGKKVDIQVGKDKTITSMTMTAQIYGVITAINPLTKQLTVKSAGQNVSFNMQFMPNIELYGKTTATLDDLKIGDTVTVDVNPGQQDTVLKITAAQTALYKVLLSNANSRQLTLQSMSGTNTTLTLDALATIVAAGKTNPAFTDIMTDEYLRLTFKGNAVTKAEVVTPVRGKVLAVDAAAGTLTVQDFAGATQMISLGSNPTVVGSNGAATTLAGVKANDRVQIMKDASDKTIINVAATAQKTYSSYNASLNQLNFTTAGGTDGLTLYARAYLHQGTQVMALGSFAANDTVTVYSIENRVIEMEK